MFWCFEKVFNVDLVVDHTKKVSDSWYEMKIAVRVNDPEKEQNEFLLNLIDIKIDMPNLLPNKGISGGEITDIKIDLID